MATNLEQVIDSEPIKPLASSANHLSVLGGQSIHSPYFSELFKTQDGVPAWWSPARDDYLNDFVKRSGHLSSALFSIQTRLAATPLHIIAKNPNIQEHKSKRDEMTKNLLYFSEFGKGWDVAYNKFLHDVFVMDNGGFLEVMGAGNEWEPIMGTAFGVRHLDSRRCTRTDNPLYPVIYEHTYREKDGSQKSIERILHYSRVIELALQPSSDVDMCGVGFSSVSRCLDMAERLVGTTNYYLEKLGSRPTRAILTFSGVTSEQVTQALAAAELSNDNARLTRFSKLVALASLDTNINVNLVDLVSLPDGFDEEISTQIAMTLVATAFGVDLREIWTANGTGASRADAVVSHLKTRGKTIGFITQFMERELSYKFLPDYLELTFDQNDDEADEMSTNLRYKRATTASALSKAGINSIRTLRQRQVADGDITEAQFAFDELQEGRLPDGSTVLSLFQSEDVLYKELLTLPDIENPLDVKANTDIEKVLDAISKQEQVINKLVVNTNIIAKKEKGLQCLQAFKALRTFYGSEPSPYQSPDHPIKLETQMMIDENGNEIPADEYNIPTMETVTGEQNNYSTQGSYSEPLSEVTDSSTGT